jgi:hypothetical protein
MFDHVTIRVADRSVSERFFDGPVAARDRHHLQHAILHRVAGLLAD